MEENSRLKRIIDLYVDKGLENNDMHDKMVKAFANASQEEKQEGSEYLNWKLQEVNRKGKSERKSKKYPKKIWWILSIVIVIIVLLIYPIKIVIAKNNISKEVVNSILKNVEYENYKIEGKYYNVLNIQMKEEFESYDYSKKKNIAIKISEMFKNEYKKYDSILIDKNSKDYSNDIVKNETDAKVVLNCKENTYTYTIYRIFKKNDKEYTEEDNLKEIIVQQLNSCENSEELVKMLNNTKYSIEALNSIINIQDIKEKCNEIIYTTAIINNNNYTKEIELLEKIPEYKDSKELINSIKTAHELDGEWYGGGYDWIINGKHCYKVYSNYSYKYTYDHYYCKYENNILYIFNNEPQMDNLENAVFKMQQENGKLVYLPYSFSQTKVTLSKISNNTKPKDKVKILEPSIGMTKTEVENSTWGKPTKINKTTTSYGVHEQWCYSNYKYIYFENGVVTSIQE